MNANERKMIADFYSRMYRITESSHDFDNLTDLEAKEEREHRRFGNRFTSGRATYNAPIVRIAEYFAVKHVLDGLRANFSGEDFLYVRPSCLMGAGIAAKFRAKIEAEFTPAEREAFAELDYCNIIK